jgi:hypothetical protein
MSGGSGREILSMRAYLVSPFFPLNFVHQNQEVEQTSTRKMSEEFTNVLVANRKALTPKESVKKLIAFALFTPCIDVSSLFRA